MIFTLLRSLKSSLTHCARRTKQQRITEVLRLEKPSKIIESNNPLTLPSPPAANVPKCHIHMFFWMLQGMAVPPLTDSMHNNIHNICIWNLVGKIKRKNEKKNREFYHIKNGSLKFSWDISILLWHGTGRSFPPSVTSRAYLSLDSPKWQLLIQQEGRHICWHESMFGKRNIFFLPTNTEIAIPLAGVTQKTDIFFPLLQNSVATKLHGRINNHASLTLPYHRQDLRYQEKCLGKKKR